MYCPNENLRTYGSVVKVTDFGPGGTRFEPNRRLFLLQDVKSALSTKCLQKLLVKNLGLIHRYYNYRDTRGEEFKVLLALAISPHTYFGKHHFELRVTRYFLVTLTGILVLR